MPTHNIAVVVLVSNTNTVEMLQPLVPELLKALDAIQIGDVVWVGAGGSRPQNEC